MWSKQLEDFSDKKNLISSGQKYHILLFGYIVAYKYTVCTSTLTESSLKSCSTSTGISCKVGTCKTGGSILALVVGTGVYYNKEIEKE